MSTLLTARIAVLLLSNLLAAVPVMGSQSSCSWFDTAPHNPQDKILYDIAQQYSIPYNNLGATVLALLYSTPLNLYNTVNTTFPTNSLSVAPGTTPGNSSLPAPNTDVIYGYLSYDLSKQDLVLSFPPYQPGRFYGFGFHDPFQDLYETIGVVGGNPPGDYLLRPSVGSGQYGLSTKDCPGQYVGCINSPTYAGRLLNRVEVYNTSDTNYVEAYLHNITLDISERNGSKVEPLGPDEWQNFSSNQFINALEVVALLGARNPPQDSNLAASLPILMACAGVDFSTQTYTPVPSVNIAQAAEFWKNITDDTFNSSTIGEFLNGTAVVDRTERQVFGNFPNSADQAIYLGPRNQSLKVGNNEAFVLTFNGKPPIKDFGFWNLEVYNSGPDGVNGLVSNPQGICSVGKNTNITYPDGTLVYAANSSQPDTTPFQILFQSADNPPPANWTRNWMPTAANGTVFRIALRPYAPKSNAINGSYVYPTQQQIPAITSS